MIGAPSKRLRLASRDVVGPVLILVLFLIIEAGVQPGFLSSSQILTLFNGSAIVALAAMGEAIVVLSGGFDLSVGSVLSVVNVLLAIHMGQNTGDQILWIVLALGAGAGIGLLNGVLVAVLQIPSVVATLATSFLWGGVALLILKQPGGSVSSTFSDWFTGSHYGIPNALVLLALATLAWLAIKRTALGISIYALGGDEGAAVANGVAPRTSLIGAYCLAGLFYGLAGVFLTAEISSGDPNIGGPLLLTIFASVVLGGISFGGGRGDAAAAILGAFILTLIADVLFALGVSSFYTSIFSGAVLIVALTVANWGGQMTTWMRARIETMRGRPQDMSTGQRGGAGDLLAGGPSAAGDVQ